MEQQKLGHSSDNLDRQDIKIEVDMKPDIDALNDEDDQDHHMLAESMLESETVSLTTAMPGI